jgi:hypothetical protein
MLARTTRLAVVLALGLTLPVIARAEPHPAIRQGLRAVNHAIVVLGRGAHDFHGHKAAALRALAAARQQLIAALHSD